MDRRISILFPAAGNTPIGGYKVIMQYANALVERGFTVSIIYSCYIPIPINLLHKILRYCKLLFRFITTKYFKGFSCKLWFDLNSSIHESYIWSLYSSAIPESDYYIATAAVTAKALNRFNVPIKNKLYFIQGYEPWIIGEAGLIETYKLDCTIITVSKWLQKIVDKYAPSYYIPNGFNVCDFVLSKPIECRSSHTISLLYHEMADKGFSYGFEALKLVMGIIPDLRVLCFGVFPKPSYFPNWFEYYQNPNKQLHNWINNEASIYLGTSIMEGYGLTIGEAMMCGQAVVCTNNPGYLEMAIPDINSLVCPVKDSHALADALIKLINDDKLRTSLAENGYRTIQNFTIEKSYSKLEALLTNCIENQGDT